MFKINPLVLSVYAFLTLIAAECVRAQSADRGINNIVLVHGAFADGSSWSKVIPLLKAQGFNVISVQNPLTSLNNDVAAAKRAIALMNGPVLLVGHSWGGVVISEAGNDTRVAGLVYVAAFAPSDGQSLNDATQGMPSAPGSSQIKPDASGFLSLTQKGIHEDFAQDLPAAERELIWITQGPWAATALGEKINQAAWKTKPSWYILASDDRMIDKDLQRAFAQKIKAKTLTLKTSHVPMLSQPAKVATFIAEAAKSTSPVK